MTTDSTYDIVILGGGIVGLALAACLADSGLRLALVDARPPAPPPEPPGAGQTPRFRPRVSALTVSSERLLDQLGVWPAIEAGGICPFRDMRVWDADGTGAIHFRAADVHRETLGHIAENAVIAGALEAGLKDRAGLDLLRPARVAGIEPDGMGGTLAPRHRLMLDDGRALRTRLLVGADGGNSPVRKALGFQVREWEYGHQAIVTTVRSEHSHQFTAWQRFMPSGPLAFLPLLNPASSRKSDQQYCSIVWSCRSALAEELMALDQKAFNRRLEAAFEARLGRVLESDERHAFALRQLHATDYVLDGAALVGDAAHTIHPLAGQGVNLGLADAAELARVVSEARRNDEDFASHRVLSRYQRRRKGPNLGMMAMMEGFKRLFESEDLNMRWLRNAGFSTVDRLPVIKNQLMSRAMGI